MNTVSIILITIQIDLQDILVIDFENECQDVTFKMSWSFSVFKIIVSVLVSYKTIFRERETFKFRKFYFHIISTNFEFKMSRVANTCDDVM